MANENNSGNDFISAIDNLDWIIKIILCIPLLDIIWAIYRIIKGATTNNIIILIFGILWIIPGSFICWIIDMVSTIIYKRPVVFA